MNGSKTWKSRSAQQI